MRRAKRAKPGSVSSWRSIGDSSFRCFSRSSEAKSCWRVMETLLSRASRCLRMRVASPKTGTTIPCTSRKTATNTRPRNSHELLRLSSTVLSPHQVHVARPAAEQLDRQLDAALAQTLLKAGHDAGGDELAHHVALLVEATSFEFEELRAGDDVALHAVGLLQADDPAPPVFLTLDLNDHVDGGCDLRAQRLGGDGNPCHGHHVLDTS